MILFASAAAWALAVAAVRFEVELPSIDARAGQSRGIGGVLTLRSGHRNQSQIDGKRHEPADRDEQQRKQRQDRAAAHAQSSRFSPRHEHHLRCQFASDRMIAVSTIGTLLGNRLNFDSIGV